MPFFARFATTRRAVGVPKSVKTVSKLTVSLEKESTSVGEELNESLMQDVPHNPQIVITTIETKKKNGLIYKKTSCARSYYREIDFNQK